MQGKRESIECGINNLVQASICVLSGSGIPMRDCKASARWGAEAKGGWRKCFRDGVCGSGLARISHKARQ